MYTIYQLEAFSKTGAKAMKFEWENVHAALKSFWTSSEIQSLRRQIGVRIFDMRQDREI
jgi:hypothetical protein